MTVSSVDFEALRLLSSPETISVFLVQRYSKSATERTRLEEDNKSLVSAVWWPSTESVRELTGSKVTLFGEIHLEKRLTPSCSVAYFKLSVCSLFLWYWDVNG
jgi:hypothetical protein